MLGVLFRSDVGLPLLFGSALLGAPLAIFVTLVVAVLFRRRVAELMNQPASDEAATLTGPSPARGSPPDPDATLRRLAQQRRVERVYVLAAIGFALAATATFMTAYTLWPPMTLRGVSTAAGTMLVFATPLPFTCVLVRSRRQSALLACVLAWLAVLCVSGWALGDPGGFVHVWGTFAAVPSGLSVIFAARRLRAGGAPIMLAAWLLVVGAQVGLVWGADRAIGELGMHFVRRDLIDLPFAQAFEVWAGEANGSLLRLLRDILSEHSGQRLVAVTHAERATFMLIQLAAACVAGAMSMLLVGMLILAWQAQRYRRRRSSEVRLSLDAMFLLFTISFVGVSAMGPTKSAVVGALGMTLSYGIYLAIGSLGFRHFRHAAEGGPAHALLLLRTFGHDRRTQHLIDALAHHWRPLGPIRLVGGEDSAHATLDLHDFYEFLVGRLRRRFEVTSQIWQRAVPDPDGLHRIESYYCRANQWQPVVQCLVQASSALLMDLRGFTQANLGCTLELEVLARQPQVHCVLLVDESTDMRMLEATLRRFDVQPARLVHAERSTRHTVGQVMQALLSPRDAHQ